MLAIVLFSLCVLSVSGRVLHRVTTNASGYCALTGLYEQSDIIFTDESGNMTSGFSVEASQPVNFYYHLDREADLNAVYSVTCAYYNNGGDPKVIFLIRADTNNAMQFDIRVIYYYAVGGSYRVQPGGPVDLFVEFPWEVPQTQQDIDRIVIDYYVRLSFAHVSRTVAYLVFRAHWYVVKPDLGEQTEKTALANTSQMAPSHLWLQ